MQLELSYLRGKRVMSFGNAMLLSLDTLELPTSAFAPSSVYSSQPLYSTLYDLRS